MQLEELKHNSHYRLTNRSFADGLLLDNIRVRAVQAPYGEWHLIVDDERVMNPIQWKIQQNQLLRFCGAGWISQGLTLQSLMPDTLSTEAAH